MNNSNRPFFRFSNTFFQGLYYIQLEYPVVLWLQAATTDLNPIVCLSVVQWKANKRQKLVFEQKTHLGLGSWTLAKTCLTVFSFYFVRTIRGIHVSNQSSTSARRWSANKFRSRVFLHGSDCVCFTDRCELKYLNTVLVLTVQRNSLFFLD